MKKDFTIDQVSWHTSLKGGAETKDDVLARFGSVVSFLQQNGLTTRTLLLPQENVDDNFSIRASDLTETGLALMKKSYDKWLTKLDESNDPTDMSIFLRALQKLRESNGPA